MNMDDKKQASGAGMASRRDFLKKGALATAAMMAGPGLFKTPVYGQKQAPFLGNVLGANDRIVAAFIGVGGQGFNSHLLNVINRNNDGSQRHDQTFNAVGVASPFWSFFGVPSLRRVPSRLASSRLA